VRGRARPHRGARRQRPFRGLAQALLANRCR